MESYSDGCKNSFRVASSEVSKGFDNGVYDSSFLDSTSAPRLKDQLLKETGVRSIRLTNFLVDETKAFRASCNALVINRRKIKSTTLPRMSDRFLRTLTWSVKPLTTLALQQMHSSSVLKCVLSDAEPELSTVAVQQTARLPK
jgi:hypothetical protein